MKRILSLALIVLLLIGSLPNSAAARSFSDVSPRHWAYNDIEQAYRDGIIAGTSVNKYTGARQFSPEAPLTNAQYIVIITRAFFPQDINNRAGNNPWYKPNDIAAERNHLYRGIKKINMDGPANRYVMALIMYNTMRQKGVPMNERNAINAAEYMIPDWGHIPEVLQAPVAVCYTKGLLSGVDAAGTFAGNRKLTRAQCAAIYPRLKNALRDSGSRPTPAPQPRPVPDPGIVPQPKPVPQPSQPAQTDFTHEVVRLVNIERAKVGAGPLTYDPRLSKLAQVRAQEATIKTGHVRPDGRGFISILDENGIRYGVCAENLAYGAISPARVVQNWMNSPGHRKNMLNPAHNKIGVGFVSQPNTKWTNYWCQLFTD